MIHGRINSAGVLTQPLLAGASGKVAHSSNSTLYLKTDAGLFCLATSTLPRGPLNLNCSLKHFDKVSNDTPWELRNEELTIGNRYTLALDETSIWSPSIPECSTTHVEHKLAIIRQILTDKQSDHIGLTSNAIDKQLKIGENALTQWLKIPNQQVPEELLKLIGTGAGLTPAGDDYLSGVLITLHYLKQQEKTEALGKWLIENAYGRTNDISLALLLAANSGNAIEPVHELLDEVFSIIFSDRVTAESCHSVIAMGHSSGWYMLSGVFAALENVREGWSH